MGYSPWGLKESDIAECLSLSQSIYPNRFTLHRRKSKLRGFQYPTQVLESGSGKSRLNLSPEAL